MEEMNRTVGALIAKVDRLIEDHAAASDARKAQYERLAAIERKQDVINAKVIATSERLDAVEKVAEEYQSIKLMGKGYLLGSAFAGGGLMFAIHDYVVTFLKALKGG